MEVTEALASTYVCQTFLPKRAAHDDTTQYCIDHSESYDFELDLKTALAKAHN